MRRAAGLALAAAVGCAGDATRPVERDRERGPYRWAEELPPGFPVPRVPADNPVTYEKVALGRHLFYDARLSGNRHMSCASCHAQERAFADDRPRGVGSTGEVHARNSMALANVAYAPVLTWANPNMRTLERQALVPMFGEHPVELGMAGREDELLARFRDDAAYRALFALAYPRAGDPITLDHITKAIASFQRTLVSGSSPYDRFTAGDAAAMSPAAVRGQAIFFSDRAECFHCHAGVTLSSAEDHAGMPAPSIEFFNNGLYNVDGRGGYPADNLGLHEFTQRAEDVGRFKAPSLRNVAVTAPYMHDGSLATLEEVIEHYDRGGRLVATGPHAGDGSRSPLKHGAIKPLGLSAADRADLLAFLRALTDSAFLRDPRHSDPTRSRRP